MDTINSEDKKSSTQNLEGDVKFSTKNVASETIISTTSDLITEDQSDDSSDSGYNAPINRQVEVDSLGRAYGTGKRKTAIARVWIKKGSGLLRINRKVIDLTTLNSVQLSIIQEAFAVTKSIGEFDVMCTVKGGGVSAQLQAIRHGTALALLRFNPIAYYASLKKSGLLTRDARRVERKKFGLKKARKQPQFSKR